ncbi:hypothetical protein ACFY3M_50725 [Streptomyces mirabilis]|uniref:hypothetical protein n=1 Tax=Streptomyces mirabilis TaxID=68239 RepID=UPI0036D067CC
MSRAFITVQPARDLRTAFARWAVAQDPKVRTVSPVDFAVPHGLFTSVPERLLVGAVVDGHTYVIPDEPEPTEAAEGPELLGVDQPWQNGGLGGPLPEVPPEAYGPGAVPLEVHPAEAADQGSAPSGDGQPTCPDCERPFKSDRALAAHRRQAHPED